MSNATAAPRCPTPVVQARVETIRHISDALNVDLGADGTVYGFELLTANEQLQASDDGTLVVVMRRSVTTRGPARVMTKRSRQERRATLFGRREQSVNNVLPNTGNNDVPGES
jgi:uncharacterized protein YuzE